MTENRVLIKTPEEAIETIKSNMPTSGYQMLRESLEMAITALKEIQQYQGIGTLEKCEEAVEKQKPKKTSDIEYDYSHFVCPNCGEWICATDDFESHKYCLNCGQAFQWDGGLEEAMKINEIRQKLKDACENTDCEKCVLYGRVCEYRGYFWENEAYMTDSKVLDAYQTYFFLKDKGPRTLEESIRFLKEIGVIPENDGKEDASKPIFSRVPPEIIRAIECVREYGCRKYPEDSWKNVDPQRYWEAALRHMVAAWKDYRAVDPESGLPHIWHVACNLAFIIELEKEAK